jgi:hypothetical protein
MLSVDGYFEGPNHDLSWHNVDDEFNKYAIEQLKDSGLYPLFLNTDRTSSSFLVIAWL